MRAELLKEDLCDPQMWMKAEARRKVEGRSFQEKVKGEAWWSRCRSRAPQLWCGLCVTDGQEMRGRRGKSRELCFFFFFTPALKLYCRKSHLVEASPLFLMASNTLKFVTMRAESFSESSRTLSDCSDRQPAVSIKAVSQWTTEGRAKNTSSSWADACWLISRQNLAALYTSI